MSIKAVIISDLKIFAQEARKSFMDEMDHTENKDYRRGFKAGLLFSYLHMIADIHQVPENGAQEHVELP